MIVPGYSCGSDSTEPVDQTYFELILELPVWRILGVLVQAIYYACRISLSSLLVSLEPLERVNPCGREVSPAVEFCFARRLFQAVVIRVVVEHVKLLASKSEVRLKFVPPFLDMETVTARALNDFSTHRRFLQPMITSQKR